MKKAMPLPVILQAGAGCRAHAPLPILGKMFRHLAKTAAIADMTHAARFARESGGDAMAVSVGNVHLQQNREGGLDEVRLRVIEAVTDSPLVIHGGSGVPVAQFVALNNPCIVHAECSNTVQGQIGTPVNARPKLTRDEVLTYTARLTELAKWMADEGMPMACHHHMGSIIESEDDVNWLMEGSGPEPGLCFDTGHLLFGGRCAGHAGALGRPGPACPLQGHPPPDRARCARK